MARVMSEGLRGAVLFGVSCASVRSCELRGASVSLPPLAAEERTSRSQHVSNSRRPTGRDNSVGRVSTLKGFFIIVFPHGKLNHLFRWKNR